MRRSQQRLFKQLDDRRLAITAVRSESSALFPEQASSFPRNTLGYLADQLHCKPEALIEQFDAAGIPGLSAEHKINKTHQEILLQFLRMQHSRGYTHVKLYEEESPVAEQIVVVQEINLELLARLAHSPQLMYQLDPRKFEELVARLLEDHGCEVTLTKRTRDGGYDVYGRLKNSVASPVFLAECKRYGPTNKVGVEVVRGLYGVTEARRANLGLIITSSSFTKDAIEEKVRIGDRIELKEFNDLRQWLARYAPAG